MARRSILLLAAVLLLGCAGGPSLDPARSSGFHDVPIPQPATADPSLTIPTGVGYRVPGVSFGDLVAWYGRQMPSGHPFEDWQPCEPFQASQLFQETYEHPGTNDLLSVVVTPGDQSGTQAGILITADESGPC